jgi:hypothetical protein
MKIGNEIFNVDFFKGWKFEAFEKFFEIHSYELTTGKTAKEVFELLGLQVEKKKKSE